MLVISYKLIDIIYFVDFSKHIEMEDTVDEGPECTDDAEAAEPVTKKKKLTNMSMLSFLTEAPKASKIQIENTSNQLANKRDYSKNKHVCMLCVNDDNLKDKKLQFCVVEQFISCEDTMSADMPTKTQTTPVFQKNNSKMFIPLTMHVYLVT